MIFADLIRADLSDHLNPWSIHLCLDRGLVPKGGLEPPRVPHTPLKRTCLPVPPLRHVWRTLGSSNHKPTHFFLAGFAVSFDSAGFAGEAAGFSAG